MASENRCKCSVNIETGSLIFATISCISTSLLTFFSLQFFIGTFIGELWGYQTSPAYKEQDNFISSAILELLTLASITLGFSIVLTRGILRRNAAHVKIYFIYGVVLTALLMLALYMVDSLPEYLEPFDLQPEFLETLCNVSRIIIIIVTFSYNLILVMIWHTYKKFEREDSVNQQFKHKILVESI